MTCLSPKKFLPKKFPVKNFAVKTSRAVLPPVLALGLSACVAMGGAPVSGDIGRWTPVRAERAAIILGRGHLEQAVAAREQRTVKGEMIQEITLANNTALPGSNRLVLMVDYGVPNLLATDPYAKRIGRYGMSPETIGETTRQEFPQATRLKPVQFRKNAYGLYGYVMIEHPDASRCVFAWQTLTPGRFASLNGAERAAVEMRLCDSHAGIDDMLALFDTLRLAL